MTFGMWGGVGPSNHVLNGGPDLRKIYESANAQTFSHHESTKKLLRKRNSGRYREPQTDLRNRKLDFTRYAM